MKTKFQTRERNSFKPLVKTFLLDANTHVLWPFMRHEKVIKNVIRRKIGKWLTSF